MLAVHSDPFPQQILAEGQLCAKHVQGAGPTATGCRQSTKFSPVMGLHFNREET